MTGLALDLLAAGLHLLFLAYAVLVITHLVLQVGCAGLHARRARQRHEAALAGAHERTGWPDVDVIVPVYNEAPDDLDLCCASLAALDYPGTVRVFLVDDGSPNRDAVAPVLERYGAREGWTVLLPERNAGKRAAQHAAIELGHAELVLTIDSDTQVAPDAVRRLVEPFDDPRTGAVTGSVRVSNAGTNLLTRLIDLRYWVAFSQERASHALFGAVLCCSGPLSMYRRRVLTAVWPRYVSQTFRGVHCTYGDDRHLTNLVLGDGWRTDFAPYASCITTAPVTVPAYLRQQTRWNKSYYRELLWTLAFLPRLSRVMAVEVGVQALLPFLLTLAVAATVGRAVVEGPEVLGRYALLVTLMAVLHCLYALVRTRDPRFLLFVAYGFLHAGLLIPVRIRALLTLDDNAWGTRTEVASTPAATVRVGR
jgi:hyaluronan synthase/N-acetylglucosaminyltransferase